MSNDHIDIPLGVGLGMREGDIVRVVNKVGCPKTNTMGHCYIERDDGETGNSVFLGLVCTLTIVGFMIMLTILTLWRSEADIAMPWCDMENYRRVLDYCKE